MGEIIDILSATRRVIITRDVCKLFDFVVLRVFNSNLAIANRSRVSCINTNNNTMTLKSGCHKGK